MATTKDIQAVLYPCGNMKGQALTLKAGLPLIKTLQGLVGGYVTCYDVIEKKTGKRKTFVMDEEGLLKGYAPNINVAKIFDTLRAPPRVFVGDVVYMDTADLEAARFE